MPMLGDMLASARKSAGMLDVWLQEVDSELAAETAKAAALLGLDVAAYARMAVADFSRLASEEDWATLVSKLRNGGDPGRLCLVGMVHWRLAAAGCASHSHSASHQHKGTEYGGEA